MSQSAIKRYRLYVDEVGTPAYRVGKHPHDSFLSLTAVLMELDDSRRLSTRLEDMKARLLGSHPDFPIILHRKDIVQRKGSFAALKDESLRGRFDEELLGLIRETEYKVITVTLDKQEHIARFGDITLDPYFYCLQEILQRYVMFFFREPSIGDVLAECRGKGEDRRLKTAYEGLRPGFAGPMFSHGHPPAKWFGELKLASKSDNIAGLQLADLLAYPSFLASLALTRNTPRHNDFSNQIIEILMNGKYYSRTRDGQLIGWGIKVIP